LGQRRLNSWSEERLKHPAARDLTDTNPSHHGLTAPEVGQCLARAARQPVYEPDPRGPLQARQALADRFGSSPERYWLTASTSEAYAWLFQVLTLPGDVVALPQPGYPLLEPLAALAGLKTRDYWFHYLPVDGWVMDQSTLAEAAGCVPLADQPGEVSEADLARRRTLEVASGRVVRRAEGAQVGAARRRAEGAQAAPARWLAQVGDAGPAPAKAIVAVNPGNPTGVYCPPGPLQRAAASTGAALIVDEVFWPFSLEEEPDVEADHFDWPGADGRRTDAAEGGESRSDGQSGPVDSRKAVGSGGRGGRASHLAGGEVLSARLDGLSKRLAAPGVKLAWIRLDGPDHLVEEAAVALDRVADTYLSVGAAPAGALPELLELENATVERIWRRTMTNLERLRSIWPGRTRRQQAGWVAVIDAPNGEADLALRLLRDHQLAVHPGWFYNIPGERALVVSLLPEPSRFASNLAALSAAV
jgi:aspartate/methionine/tyrosine aminotransferase